jgi:hypothetical protein
MSERCVMDTTMKPLSSTIFDRRPYRIELFFNLFA